MYTPGRLCRKRRPWSKFCIIEDIVVSYTSKVEIFIRDFEGGLRFLVLGLRSSFSSHPRSEGQENRTETIILYLKSIVVWIWKNLYRKALRHVVKIQERLNGGHFPYLSSVTL